MDKAKKAEFDKIFAKLHVERIESFEDPVEQWAVTSLRNVVKQKHLAKKRLAKNKV